MSLKPKQIQAAMLLAEGWLCKNVADELDVTPQTISEWQKLAEFEAYLNSLKEESLKAARTHIQRLAETASETIAELMESSESDSIRLKAAETVLAHSGLSDKSTGLFLWGVGSTTVEEVEKDRERDRHIKVLGYNALGI